MATVEAPNLGQGNGNHRGGRNGGRERGRGRVARLYGRGHGQCAHVNASIGEPTVAYEAGERAQLFAAIDNPGAPQ